MHGDPAMRDGGFNRRAVFLIAATGIAEDLVDRADVYAFLSDLGQGK
jgi:hypothetical protein